MKGLAILFGLAAMLAVAAPVRAQEGAACQLMIDASGSMGGYYDAERQNYAPEAAGARLRPMLEGLRRLCSRTMLFDLVPRDLARDAPIGAGPSDTDIGRSLEEWSRTAPDGTFLIMVTDNVEDPGTGNASGNARFYELLRRRDSAFSHVTVLALRAPFQGRLYPSDRNRPGVPYAGPRAFTIYLLGKRAEGRDAQYRATRAALERLLAQSGRREFEGSGSGDYSSYVLFDVRPFAVETFRVRAQNVAVRASRRGGSRCPRTRFDPPAGPFILYDQQMGVRCDVAAVLTVAIPQRWCLNDTSLRATASLDSGDPSLREGLTATVTPPRADLCSRDQELRTSLVFNPIKYDPNVSFAERLRRSFWGTFEAHGDLRIIGSLSRDDVNLGEGIMAGWSFDAADGIASPDPSMQRRVFQLDSAVRSVVPEAMLTNNELVRYPIHIRGRYKQGPVLAIVAVALFLLLLLALLVLLARKPRTLRVESDDGADTLLRLRLFGSGRAPSASPQLAIILLNLGFGLFVRSTGRIVRGRFLSPGGGRVEVLPAGAARPRAARRGPGGDEFDSYDSGDVGSDSKVTFSIRSVSARDARREDDYDDGF